MRDNFAELFNGKMSEEERLAYIESLKGNTALLNEFKLFVGEEFGKQAIKFIQETGLDEMVVKNFLGGNRITLTINQVNTRVYPYHEGSQITEPDEEE